MNPLYAFRFNLTGHGDRRDVLMVFVANAQLDPMSLATTIEHEIQVNLLPDEVLLIVREPAFDTIERELATVSLNQATLGRLGTSTTVTLAAYDRRGEECRRGRIAGPELVRQTKFDDFKRRAISNIFSERHGFVESTPIYHFVNPSGRHTERFIRLSNILVRGAEIRFIGFCTLPFIPDGTTTAYLDTPALYAIVSAINEQLVSFNAPTILADNFKSYAGLSEYQFGAQDNAFVLISASSSGSLAKILCQDHGFEPAKIAHLLFLGVDKSSSNIVCDLRADNLENPEGVTVPPAVETPATCLMCAGGSVAIALQGDQFEFAGPQQETLLIRKVDAPTGLGEAMERTVGRGVFGVGLGDSTKRQPRIFQVSPAALLECPGFRNRLDYALRRSVPASAEHIVALDESSEPLAEMVAEHLDLKAAVINRKGLDAIPTDTKSAVVIAAAVLESGRSLQEVSRDLRSVAPSAPLLYLVGFSKTTAEGRRKALAKNLAETVNYFPYEYLEIERLILPQSSSQNPWKQELDLFLDPDISVLVPAELEDFIKKRIGRLRRTSEVLENDLFVPNAIGRALKLQPGFVFWPPATTASAHSQADVFFTMASVLQTLRANSNNAEKIASIKSNRFQQTILAPGNFGRYNDDLIQACLLRGAYPAELNYADSKDDSKELARLIRRIIEAASAERGGAAAEFLLALATGRLQLYAGDEEVVLSVESTDAPVVSFLQQVYRTMLSRRRRN